MQNTSSGWFSYRQELIKKNYVSGRTSGQKAVLEGFLDLGSRAELKELRNSIPTLPHLKSEGKGGLLQCLDSSKPPIRGFGVLWVETVSRVSFFIRFKLYRPY